MLILLSHRLFARIHQGWAAVLRVWSISEHSGQRRSTPTSQQTERERGKKMPAYKTTTQSK